MIKENVLLSSYSNYQIGGPAKLFGEPQTIEELKEMIQAHTGRLFILGGGTNILFPDEGFDGLVIRPDFSVLERDGNSVRAGAGVSIDDLLAFTTQEALSGLEWAGGLPGLLGGAIRGNAGAFGGEIKDSIQCVTSLDISGDIPKVVERNGGECEFDYRTSIFKKRESDLHEQREIIVECVFRLQSGDSSAIRALIDEKIQYRKDRQPLEYPNVGSIFKNVDVKKLPQDVAERFKHKIKTDPFPVLPTAVLNDAAELKGVTHGGAMISPKHPNFIVNVNEARAADVKALIAFAKKRIKNRFGVELEEEVIIL